MIRAAIIAIVAVGCGKTDSNDGHVAELVEINGLVEASPNTAPTEWATTAAGRRFVNGDGVRTGDSSEARVKVTRGGGTMRMGADSEIRFGRHNGLTRVRLRTGSAVIESGEQAMFADTTDGTTRLRPGSRVRLARTTTGTQVDVMVGLAVIEQIDAEPIEVRAGSETLVKERKVTTLPQKPTVAASAEIVAAVTTTQEIVASPAKDVVPTATKRTGLVVGGRRIKISAAPEQSPVTVHSASAVIHDPSPPAAVALPASDCPGDTIVEVRGRRAKRKYYRGSNVVSVVIGRGTNRYRVFCFDGTKVTRTKKRGTIRLLRDNARRRVQVRAPRNSIRADGRNYRLMYQNRKPQITFEWPTPHEDNNYTLVVAHPDGETQRYSARSPRHTVESGKIDDGSYRWWFETADGQRSKQSTLTVEFDNTAPAAQLSEPTWGAEEVEIRGLVAVGSKVWISDTPVPLDRKHRFTVSAKRESGNAVTIRVVRRRGDTHYYVLRPES